MQFTPVDPVVIDGCYLLDMKSDDNLHKFDTFRNLGVRVNPGELKEIEKLIRGNLR